MLIDWSMETPEGREVVLQLVSIILSISACNGQYPTQETISEMPFGFWYIFQVIILHSLLFPSIITWFCICLRNWFRLWKGAAKTFFKPRYRQLEKVEKTLILTYSFSGRHHRLWSSTIWAVHCNIFAGLSSFGNNLTFYVIQFS